MPEQDQTVGKEQEAPSKTAPDNTQSAEQQKKEKRGEWIVAPIPLVNPAIGAGLAWGVGYVFPFSKQDKVSPNSVVGVGGLFTNNGSRALAAGGRLYFKEDKYRSNNRRRRSQDQRRYLRHRQAGPVTEDCICL